MKWSGKGTYTLTKGDTTTTITTITAITAIAAITTTTTSTTLQLHYHYNHNHNYNIRTSTASTTLQLQLPLPLQLQLQLHCIRYTTLHPAVVGEVTTATIPKTPSPFGPPVALLCHPCITTSHLAYSFLSLKLPPLPCAVLLLTWRSNKHMVYDQPRRSIQATIRIEPWKMVEYGQESGVCEQPVGTTKWDAWKSKSHRVSSPWCPWKLWTNFGATAFKNPRSWNPQWMKHNRATDSMASRTLLSLRTHLCAGSLNLKNNEKHITPWSSNMEMENIPLTFFLYIYICMYVHVYLYYLYSILYTSVSFPSMDVHLVRS